MLAYNLNFSKIRISKIVISDLFALTSSFHLLPIPEVLNLLTKIQLKRGFWL